MELREKEEINKKKKKKVNKFSFILIIVVALFFAGIKLDDFCTEQIKQQNLEQAKQQRQQMEITRKEREQKEIENKKAFIQKMSEKEKALVEQNPDNIEPNSKQMMGYILSKANQDAQNIISEDEKFKNAFQFIKDNYPNYFENNDMMEKTMYYSKIIQYVYDPRWENYKDISVDFEEVYSVWDDTYLKTERPPKSLMMIELSKFNISEQVGAAVRRVYLNMETIDSEIVQAMLVQAGMKLNSLYPNETFWKVPEQENKQAVDASKEMMVWIPTNGGIKYHLDASCSDMINPEYITESQAQARGFTPCKKCF